MIAANFFKSLILAALTLASAAMLFPASAEDHAQCHVKFGVVPQFEQRRLFAIWSPIMEMLSERTGCYFEFIGSKSIIDFERAFKAGEYDFAYMNPYHVVMAMQSQGYEPILRSGQKKLKGILVTHRDNSIKDLSELTGKTVAFPSPNALGASLMMRAELARDFNSYPDPFYVKTHSSVYLYVAKGLAEAGGGVARTLEEQPDFVKDQLKVIHTTRPVYAHPVVVHPRIAEDLRADVQKIWLEAGKEGFAPFADIPMDDPAETSYSDYRELEEFGLEKFIGHED